MVRTAIVTIVCAAVASTGAAQTAPQTPSLSDASFSFGYEVHRDHVRYKFENPSTFDTEFLVPHTFVQTYVANNQWFVAAARYPALGDMWETEFGVTPTRTAFASDLDTFFDPNGDVIVSGTVGSASMHAIRFAQWSEGRLWDVPVRTGYVFRRDVAKFLPADRVVTHSNPSSISRTPVTADETTISRVQEGVVGTWRQMAVGTRTRWLVVAGVDVSPLIVAQLQTILPEKYPGQKIVFQAKAAAVAARLDLMHGGPGWPIVVTAHYDRTWSYRASNQFSRNALQAGIRVRLQR